MMFRALQCLSLYRLCTASDGFLYGVIKKGCRGYPESPSDKKIYYLSLSQLKLLFYFLRTQYPGIWLPIIKSQSKLFLCCTGFPNEGVVVSSRMSCVNKCNHHIVITYLKSELCWNAGIKKDIGVLYLLPLHWYYKTPFYCSTDVCNLRWVLLYARGCRPHIQLCQVFHICWKIALSRRFLFPRFYTCLPIYGKNAPQKCSSIPLLLLQPSTDPLLRHFRYPLTFDSFQLQESVEMWTVSVVVAGEYCGRCLSYGYSIRWKCVEILLCWLESF